MGTVSASYLEAIVKTCIAQGAKKTDMPESFVHNALNTEELAIQNPGTRFPAGMVFQTLAITAKTTGKTEIGLQCGKYIRPASLNELGSAIMCCGSLRQAININRRYQSLTQQLGYSRLEIEGDQARLIWEPHYMDAEYGRMVTDLVMTGHAIFGRWLSWVHDKKINAVSFQHAEPAYAPLYQEIFDCPILFAQDENAMFLDTGAIDAPLPQANEALLAEICRKLDRALEEMQPSMTYRDQVAGYLRREMQKENQDGPPVLAQVARHMGVSARSLRRNLAREKTGFRQILEQARRELCEQWLAEGKALFVIAENLGYSQQSAFNRAFKQWFGATPKAYMKAQATLDTAFDQLAP